MKEKIEKEITEKFENILKHFLNEFNNIPAGIENNELKLKLTTDFLENDFSEFSNKELIKFKAGSQEYEIAEEIIGSIYIKIFSNSVLGK